MKRTYFLSKSQFLRGMQCHKSLYLYKHHKDLRGEVNADQEAKFSNGTDVGILAQELFSGGIEVPFEGMSIPQQVEMTAREIERGARTIYEASFVHDGIFVKVDILHRGAKGWELYEVKSSTSVKEVYLHDVALQWHVLAGAGIEVEKAALVHINNRYVRTGEIDVKALFAIQDLTGSLAGFLEAIPARLEAMRSQLDGPMPAIDIGRQCSAPYDCDFRGHCWSHIPEDSIFSLRGRGIDKFACYDGGITSLQDLPLDSLNQSQRFQVEMHLSQGEHLDRKGLRKFLSTLWYPLCHLDFETFMSPVPHHDGMRPYQQIPFQYSLHIQREAGGPVEHFEYLAEPNTDPRPGLIHAMLRDIPEDACVLTFNMAFEKTRLKELIKDFSQYAEELSSIHGRVMDLIVPFRKRHVYRWQQRGSNSIKDVLPAFIPGMSYKDLDISDGGMAMEAYHLMYAERDQTKLRKLRKDLLAYCQRDTEAMVKLHQCLLAMVS